MDFITFKALIIIFTIPLYSMDPSFTTAYVKITPTICTTTAESQTLPLFMQDKTYCLNCGVRIPKKPKDKENWFKKNIIGHKTKPVIFYENYLSSDF